MKVRIRYAVAFFAVVVAAEVAVVERPLSAQKSAGGLPTFQVDPSWPTFEGNWLFGSIGGVFVDPTNDHVWVLNRPRRLQKDEDYAAQKPPAADCCVPPPFVMEFDQSGKVLKSWGGPGAGYEWPANEHGLSIDSKGNFWIAGNGKGDAQVLKFSRDGKFLLQIGHFGKSNGSNDLENFASPTKATYYAKTNEVFVTDGYINRRVAVFDADSGKYKRHWGAYGKTPDDSAPNTRTYEGAAPEQFNLAHDVQISRDVRKYVKNWVKNSPDKTILLTTHYMAEADELCDRIAIIDQGKVVACDTPANLKRLLRQEAIFHIEVNLSMENLDRFSTLRGVKNFAFEHKQHVGKTELKFILESDSAISHVTQALQQDGTKIISLSKTEPSLEDVFVALVGKVLENAS